jgi:hypothetical protein
MFLKQKIIYSISPVDPLMMGFISKLIITKEKQRDIRISK